MSQLFKLVAKRFRISQIRTTAFHLQSNGSIEKSHHVLTEYLKHYISKNNWDEWLDLAMFSYNTSVHVPSSLRMNWCSGRLARVPSSDTALQETGDETYDSYLRELQQKLIESTDQARLNLDSSKIRSKSYYDRKVNRQQFLPGDKVYLLSEPKKGKFAAEYTGPHVVLEIYENNNVKISYKRSHRIVHSNKLKHVKAKTPASALR